MRNGSLRPHPDSAASGVIPLVANDGIDCLGQLVREDMLRNRELDCELQDAKSELASLVARRGRRTLPILRYLGATSPEMADKAEAVLRTRIASLQNDREASRPEVRFEPADQVSIRYRKLSTAFDALAKASRIWSLPGGRLARGKGLEDPQFRRPGSLERRSDGPVAFPGTISFSDGSRSIQIYPGFAIVCGPGDDLRIHDILDLKVLASTEHLAEPGPVPIDTLVVRNDPAIWTRHDHPNMRGGDRLPICSYGRVSLHVGTDVIGAFLVSASDVSQGFADAFADYVHDIGYAPQSTV